MPMLKFYDVKKKKSFSTDKYKVIVKKGRRFAVAKSPLSKIECYRILGNK